MIGALPQGLLRTARDTVSNTTVGTGFQPTCVGGIGQLLLRYFSSKNRRSHSTVCGRNREFAVTGLLHCGQECGTMFMFQGLCPADRGEYVYEWGNSDMAAQAMASVL